MKLLTYSREGIESFGLLTEQGIIDIPSLWPDGPADVLSALQAGPDTMQRLKQIDTSAKAENVIDPSTVKILAPIPNPPKVIGLAGNYVEHIREFDNAGKLSADPRNDTTPRPFLMPATTIANPGDEITWPSYSKELDYEIELAIVIGQSASKVSADQARNCIAGYTIANDISARSVTHSAGRSERPRDKFFDWLHGKWADGFCPIGPCIVTADELADPQKLDIELKVNGQTRQQANTAQMIFDVFEIVAFCSQLMTLLPGDIIATGTPSGVGAASGTFLAPGDEINCRIESIGEMTNRVGPRPADFFQPCI